MAEDKNDRTALFLAAEEDRVEVLEVRECRSWIHSEKFILLLLATT